MRLDEVAKVNAVLAKVVSAKEGIDSELNKIDLANDSIDVYKKQIEELSYFLKEFGIEIEQ